MRPTCLLAAVAVLAAATAAAETPAPYAGPVTAQITSALDLTEARGLVLAGARVTLALEIEPDGDIAASRIVEIGGLADEADTATLEALLGEALERLQRSGFDNLPKRDHDLWGVMAITFRLGVRSPFEGT